MAAVTTGVEAPQAKPAWHSLTADDACEQLDVHPRSGLDAHEVERRRERFGPNKLAEAEKEPGWRAFLRQYRDLMQLVLLGAAIVSMVALQEFATGLVIIGLTVLNAVLGPESGGQGGRERRRASEDARDQSSCPPRGELADVPAEELVPGDIVVFEAGDKIPADGRLLVAATLEIEEAALTGESTPVLKAVDPVAGADVPLGDRLDMAYMNSHRDARPRRDGGHGDRHGTEVGQISGMLSGVQQEKTPLTRQLDQLTVLLTIMAGAALALVVVIGLLRGDDFDELFLIGISLAVAAIPTGLPAVVTTVLSLGTQALAAKGAIVKRLRSVETLGSTSAICSDKTGTLTLNQMTARQLVIVGRRYSIEGEGYSTEGQILRVGGETDTPLEPFMMPMALANDAAVRDGEIVGDPTEAALVVLAAKGGLDVDETRRAYPRVGEVPFDSEYKLMATFHELEDDGRKVVRCFVKGAPDVLLARSSHDPRTRTARMFRRSEARDRVLAENDRLAGEGLRVLAVASRDLDRSEFHADGDLLDEVQGLTLLALVGIVDPPRKEAKDAIARCKEAGIRARMITGDHATTAAAIAAQLGIEGRALTGTEFAALSDAELDEQVDEHRRGRTRRAGGQGAPRRRAEAQGQRRLDDRRRRQRRTGAQALGHRRRDGDHRHRGDEGSGRHDPHRRQLRHHRRGGRGRPRHLRQPDEVRARPARDAGRLHPHLRRRRHLRHRRRRAAHAAADPLDQLRRRRAAGDRARLRRRRPRADAARAPGRERADRRSRARDPTRHSERDHGRPCPGVVAWGEERYDLVVATTMGLTTLSLMHIVAALEAREPTGTIFSRYTIANRRFVQLIGAALVLTFLVTELSPLQRIFDTVPLTSSQWGICLLGPIAFLAFVELGKLVDRQAEERSAA